MRRHECYTKSHHSCTDVSVILAKQIDHNNSSNGTSSVSKERATANINTKGDAARWTGGSELLWRPNKSSEETINKHSTIQRPLWLQWVCCFCDLCWPASDTSGWRSTWEEQDQRVLLPCFSLLLESLWNGKEKRTHLWFVTKNDARLGLVLRWLLLVGLDICVLVGLDICVLVGLDIWERSIYTGAWLICFMNIKGKTALALPQFLES